MGALDTKATESAVAVVVALGLKLQLDSDGRFEQLYVRGRTVVVVPSLVTRKPVFFGSVTVRFTVFPDVAP